MAQVSQHFTFLAFSLRLLGLAYLVIIVSAHLFPSFNIQKIANLASQNILSACSSVLKGAWDKFMLKRDLAKEPSGFRRLQAWRPPSIPIWLIQIADSSKGRVLHKKNSTCGYARLVHVYYHKKALGFYLGPLLLLMLACLLSLAAVFCFLWLMHCDNRQNRCNCESCEQNKAGI